MSWHLQWPPQFLDRSPCGACGKATSKWFRFKLRDGRSLHAHCTFKEATP